MLALLFLVLVIWLILSAPVLAPVVAGAAVAVLALLVIRNGMGPTTVPPQLA